MIASWEECRRQLHTQYENWVCVWCCRMAVPLRGDATKELSHKLRHLMRPLLLSILMRVRNGLRDQRKHTADQIVTAVRLQPPSGAIHDLLTARMPPPSKHAHLSREAYRPLEQGGSLPRLGQCTSRFLGPTWDSKRQMLSDSFGQQSIPQKPGNKSAHSRVARSPSGRWPVGLNACETSHKSPRIAQSYKLC